MPARIPLDPALPKNFDCTPNEKRSKAQLDAWWDRPSVLGFVDNYDEACELAERQQARWVKTRSKPSFILARMPQRPDHQQEIVAEFSSRDEMNLFSLRQEEGDHVEVSPTLDHNRMNLTQLAWYSKELEMSIARLENEKAAIQAQHEVILDRIKEMQNDNRG
ncbi:DNA-binding protein [Escherichia coli]|uniref:DNA-binding protein n=1 Tax=Escherichia coli TaxID=562 RepID=UPI001ECF82AE|nr:DNA-binding protein [Escherichia coli]EES5504472.1 DNA-binding protein [Escherichia coli]EES5751005.1 DNA-binding protein [Escherichia coli]EES6084775.1 DNA-binding protein [Escherichia coli]